MNDFSVVTDANTFFEIRTKRSTVVGFNNELLFQR